MSDQRQNIFSSPVVPEPSAPPLLTEIRYRRHRIVWDTRPQLGTPYWTGRVAVVTLGDGSIKKKIERIAEDACNTSEEETRRYLIDAAKDWIDKKIAQSQAPDYQYGGIIAWDQSFSVGIKEIDEQHQELIKIINCLVENEDATGHSEPIAHVLDRMTQYAAYHFETEEALMLQYDYPAYESHRDDHTQFKLKTAKFCLDALLRKETLPEELLSYLRDWFTRHILEADMKYKRYFLEQGVSLSTVSTERAP